MVRRGTPKDIHNYVKISSDIENQNIVKNGFQPIWIDKDCVYYKRTNDLIKFMEREEIIDE